MLQGVGVHAEDRYSLQQAGKTMPEGTARHPLYGVEGGRRPGRPNR